MIRIFLLLLLSYCCLPELSGQALSFDLKKPKKYEDKKLGSEKSADKKFTAVRRFTQNGITKFNWNFNAATRLQEIIDKSKAAHKDDYNNLLSFYNYTLEGTARNKADLDSVIYKANAGILIHDLLNSWIDNLYMLMGQAYYFRNELDTAYLTFQYINYAFAPKEKDGYDKPIGSNATEGGNAFSVSTVEKRNIVDKVWSRPSSRNESFIWQIKTYIAKDELSQAAGMIETLKSDPFFPERLDVSLFEEQAHWFYKQQIYDSAAIYLEKALGNAENKQEEARWEYLIGQLYERAGEPKMAIEFFERATRHTLNPVLEVYARLNTIRQNKGDEKVIAQNVEALIKMARRDRYTNYRDIIYYTAAQMELERNNIAGAKALLLKATSMPPVSPENSQRTPSFLLLADLSFQEKKYAESLRFYDSVNISDPALPDFAALQMRKNLLIRIVEQTSVIDRQDSLQRIAAMPEKDRESYIKKLVRQLRKQQGIKEEDVAGGGSDINKKNEPSSDLFSNNKGDWYFQNPALKSRGYTDFKAKWGNRQNTDNWRRASAASRSNTVPQVGVTPTDNNGIANSGEPIEISYEGLLKLLPLTPEQMKISNDSLEQANFMLGKIFTESAEDYESAITILEEFLVKYPASTQRTEALFLLHYCYTKTGNSAKAAAAKNTLDQKYPGSSFQQLVSNPQQGTKADRDREEMTKKYENIYTLFIEGKFEEALAEKKSADSVYGKNYWTPQLLYIQSVYYIKQRMDEEAKNTLQQIISLYPSSPLTPKAQNMLDVLGRRKEIEEYLVKLQVERPKEDSLGNIADNPPVNNQPGVPVVVKGNEKPPVLPATDSVKTTIPRKDSVQQKPTPVDRKDTIAAKPVVPIKSSFTADNNASHYVVVILEKVDPVYVGEARNAFNRYNKQTYYNKPIDIVNQPLNDTTTLVLMSPFENAAAALDYMEKTRKIAATEIVPWMPAGKLNFAVISAANLELLKSTNDLPEYKKFIRLAYPGKFDQQQPK